MRRRIMFNSVRKWLDEYFFAREIAGYLLPPGVVAIIPGAAVIWGTINRVPWGFALLAGIVCAAFTMQFLNLWVDYSNKTRLVGNVRWGGLNFRENGENIRLEVDIVNGTNMSRYIKVEEIQGSTNCNPLTWELLCEKWPYALHVPPNAKNEVTISHMPRVIRKASTPTPGFQTFSPGHRHYRVKLRVGKTEDNLSSGMVFEFYANQPIVEMNAQGNRVELGGGGDLVGARYHDGPISDWPRGFGMSCEEAKA